MALAEHKFHDDNWKWPLHNIWNDRFSHEWEDWPLSWPRPRDIISRLRRNSDRWWYDWPTDWPRFDAIAPRFTSHLDRFDRNWRHDPFWSELYPRWAEPIFKEGIDVKTTITNDQHRFAVDMETYQFRPEELQVKTLDDTLLIEGRHEDVRDPDNYTKMYFIRKYQLPSDVHPEDITSHIDSRNRLTVEARKQVPAIKSNERTIPIESSSTRLRPGSRSSSYSPRNRNDSGRGSDSSYHHNISTTPQPQSNLESRNTTYDNNYIYNQPKSNKYSTKYSSRSTNANGMRQEEMREEFREFHRNGSYSPLVSQPQPIISEYHHRRSGSHHSNNDQHNQSDASSRNDYRVETPEHTLQRSEEIGDGFNSRKSESARSVRIQRTYN